MINLSTSVQELCDLVANSTFEEFIPKVEITSESELLDIAYIDFDYKATNGAIMSATIADKQRLCKKIDHWNSEGNWIWNTYLKEYVYFKS